MSSVGELTKEIVRLQIYLFVLKEQKSDLAIRVNYGSVSKPSFHQIHKKNYVYVCHWCLVETNVSLVFVCFGKLKAYAKFGT